MTVYLFIGAATLFLVIGIVFIIRGIKISTENQSAIPISDLAEIKQINKGHKGPNAAFKPKNPDLTAHLLRENQQSTTAADQTRMLENLQAQISRLNEENKHLQSALDRELSSQKLATVSQEDQRIIREKEELYKRSQTSIEALTQENQRLVKNIENLQTEGQKWKETVLILENETRQIEQQAALKMQTLQKTADDFTSQRSELEGKINVLEAENHTSKDAVAALEVQLKEIQQQAALKVQTVQKTADELKQENQVLQQDKEKIQALEKEKAELTRSSQEMTRQLDALREDLSQLQDNDIQQNLKYSQETEQLKGEKEVLHDQKSKLENMLSDLQQKYFVQEKDHAQRIERAAQEVSILQKELQNVSAAGGNKVSQVSAELKEQYAQQVARTQQEIAHLKRQIEDHVRRPPQIVEKVIEVEKIVEVEKVVEKIVEVERVVEVERIVERKDEAFEVKFSELSDEAGQLKQGKLALESELKKVREFNSHLIEKEKFLQYELTKHRAHAMGLEKICEDLRLQNEQMSKI